MTMRKWALELLSPCLAIAFLLGSVLALGQWTRQQMQSRQAYTLTFNEIDCAPPPGVSRADFLAEVQYLGGLRDELTVLDEDVSGRLARAFARHPWVEEVRRVEIQPVAGLGGEPGYRARVEMVHRQPVLAVRVRQQPALLSTTSPNKHVVLLASQKVSWRAVDRHGVLLPMSASCDRLPLLQEEVAPPAGPAGTVWGDSEVEKAATTAAFLEPYLGQLNLQDCRLQIVDGDVLLSKPDVRVLWGRAPGHEGTREAPALVKVKRLLELKQSQRLTGLEHDVRLRAHNGHFPLLACAYP
jgi:hypothetical protein